MYFITIAYLGGNQIKLIVPMDAHALACLLNILVTSQKVIQFVVSDGQDILDREYFGFGQGLAGDKWVPRITYFGEH